MIYLERLDSRYSAMEVAEQIVNGSVTCQDQQVREAAYKLLLALKEMQRLTGRN